MIYFNTTACVGSSWRRKQCNPKYAISIQLLVSVRASGISLNSSHTTYFNTTACVGSRIYYKCLINGTIGFQYNCLCRFEIMKIFHTQLSENFNTTACVGSREAEEIRESISINFNTTACVGSSRKKSFSDGLFLPFQYNCLCRFENRNKYGVCRSSEISIQRLVSVRASSRSLIVSVLFNFNTTACVGSR